MLNSTPTNLKPVAKFILSTVGATSFLDRPAVPLEFNPNTQKLRPTQMPTRGNYITPSPFVLHFEIPAGTQMVIRAFLRSLPVIHYYVRGREGYMPLGFNVATTDTRFLGSADSGDVTVMASSSNYDEFQFPPIDIPVPMSADSAVVQLIYYAMPRPTDIIEVFSDQGRCCDLGTAYKSSIFYTQEPGIITGGQSALTADTFADFINNECAKLVLDNAHTNNFQFAVIISSTWYQASEVNFQLTSPLGSPDPIPATGIRFDDFTETFAMRAVPFHTGVCHYTPVV